MARAATRRSRPCPHASGGPQSAEVPHEVLQYHHDPRSESFGEEAVQKLAQVQGKAVTADIRA